MQLDLELIFIASGLFMIIFSLPLFIKVYRHENIKINKPIKGNNPIVLQAIDHVRGNFPNFFNDKKEKSMFIFLDESNNILEVFLKPMEKRDGPGQVKVPWEIIKMYFAKKYSNIVCIHSHPSGNMRGSYGDALVHEVMEKNFKKVTSIVVSKDVGKFIEYNKKRNYFY